MNSDIELKLGEYYANRKGLSVSSPVSLDYAIFIDLAFFVEDFGHSVPFLLYAYNCNYHVAK